jgi:hypothetical protein
MGSTAAKDLDRLTREAKLPRPHGVGGSAEGGVELGAGRRLVPAPRASAENRDGARVASRLVSASTGSMASSAGLLVWLARVLRIGQRV